MGRATPIKVSFNAGELSPLLDGRTDQAKYQNGASIVENFLATVQGPLIRRGGFYFAGECKVSIQRSWLRRFVFNVTQSYVLEFGHQYIRFFTNRGQVLEAAKTITGITQANPGVVTSAAHGFSNGDYVYITGVAGMTQLNGQTCKVAGATANTFQLQDVDGVNLNTTGYGAYTSGGTVARIYQITTPYNVADLTNSEGLLNLSFEQSGDVLYIAHPSYKTQKLSRLGALNWTIAEVPFENGPFMDNNTTETTTVYITSPYGDTVTATANNGAGLVRVTVGSTAGLTTGNKVVIYGITGTVEANGEWIITVINGTQFDLQNSAYSAAYVAGGSVLGSEGTSVTITASSSIFNSGHVGTLFYIEQPINDTYQQWEVGLAVTAGALRRSGVNCYIALNAGTTGSTKPTHTNGNAYDGNPGVRWHYYDSGYGIVQITSQAGTSATGVIKTKIPLSNYNSSNRTSIWAYGLFSDANGWPEVVKLFRERVVYVRGLRGVLSVSGDYDNFAKKINGVISADAAIQFTIPDSNPARWMADANDLLMGTAGREIAVGEITTSEPLGPGNTKARKHTSHGSRMVDPSEVGGSILFVTRSGKKLREIRYSFESNGYQSSDLTVLSEHIAKDGIIQMAYQQEPHSINWCATADGNLLGFTYEREQDVLAWTRHPVGGSAVVESVCCIPSPDGKGDDLWIQARLTINGATRRYIGWMKPYFDGDDSTIEDAFYVDFGLTYDGSATTTITGLHHLKGATVDILADGGTHVQKTVSASGTVTLDRSASVVQVGLPCPARLRTMRLDAGSALGTAQGKIKRITRILLRFLKTLGGTYGPSQSKQDTIIYHEGGESMDTPPPLLTGDKTLPFPGGYDTEGYVDLNFNTPTPVTIITVVTDVQTNEN